MAAAAFPRTVGTTALPSDRLRVVYHKYTSTTSPPHGATVINLIFAHGTGMNKSVWTVHIKKLFELSKRTGWKLGAVISLDHVSHGDSALLNRSYLGWTSSWIDASQDLIAVVKHEMETCGDFVPSAFSRNIVIGHSMGGFVAAYAGYLQPSLFDSIIAVEPVLVYDASFTPIFTKRVKRILLILKEEFASKEEAMDWFNSKSFYNKMEPEALDEFAADEITCENGRVFLKTSIQSQVASYLSVILNVEAGQSALQYIRIPFFHIVGSTALWNPPEAVDFIRSLIPSNLLETADLDGEHLVHVTNVKDTVDLIASFINRRASFLSENRLNFPEVKFENDRQAIVKHKWAEVLNGDIQKSVSFAIPLKGQAKL